MNMNVGIALAIVAVFLVLRFFFKVSKWIIRLAFLCIAAVAIVMHFMRTP